MEEKLENYVSVEEQPTPEIFAEKPENYTPISEPQTTQIPADTFTFSRVTFNYIVIAVVFFIVGIGVGVFAFGDERSSSDIMLGIDRAELTDIVRQAVIDAGGVGGGVTNREELVDDDPYIGPADAPITIVEFSDFNCPYCSQFVSNTMSSIIDTYGDQVRFVFRDMPVVTQESFNTAMSAQCAHEQGKFWDYHNALFADPQARGRDAYITLATRLEMNIEQFTECFDTQKYKDEVTLDWLASDQYGVSGTPAFFINNRTISGAQPFERFALVIDTELRALGLEPPVRGG